MPAAATGARAEFSALPPEAETHRACARCIGRAWLLQRLSGNLERVRGRLGDVLALPDDELIVALAGRQRDAVDAELRALDASGIRTQAARARVEMVCRCDAAYPRRLRELAAPPAVLHVAGGLGHALALLDGEPVAIVGARRASSYGVEVARSLARGLGAAGVTVISGMALGIDSAAHSGALAACGRTIAVLPGGADRPYPPSQRALHGRIAASGAIVSELPAGARVARWGPPARNRIIAALASMTLVVEAAHRSGALLTAAHARTLGRPVGAVPGRVTSGLAAGPIELIRAGATAIRGAQDILDELFGAGMVRSPQVSRPPLSPAHQRLLVALEAGEDTLPALARAGFRAEQALAGLSALELAGYVRRGAGGRFVVVA